jgi:hypothetical protein
VSIIHRVSRGQRYRMTVERPQLRSDPGSGKVLNDWLRGSSGKGAAVLTGQLFAAYGAVLPAAPEGALPVAVCPSRGGDIWCLDRGRKHSEMAETEARRRTRGTSGGVPVGTSSSAGPSLRVGARGSAIAAIRTPRSRH